MLNSMEIGPTPCDEPCAQLGSYGFEHQASKEMKAYINQLYRQFPDAIDNGVRFKARWFNHDFGRYGEVVIYWDDEDPIADEFAYKYESNLPEKWDEEALKELGNNNE